MTFELLMQTCRPQCHAFQGRILSSLFARAHASKYGNQGQVSCGVPDKSQTSFSDIALFQVSRTPPGPGLPLCTSCTTAVIVTHNSLSGQSLTGL